MQAFYDGMTFVGSLVVMALVVAATYYASRWYAGRMSKTASGRHIKIVDRVSVGPGCALVVLQAGNRFYLVGQSDKNLQLICELTDFHPDIAEAPAAQASFGQLIDSFLKKSPDDGNPKDNGG